jgi:hypothetical protein
MYKQKFGISRNSSPLDKGRCWKNYKPNPDGRPASAKGSCVPINRSSQKMKFEKANRERYEAMPQKTKDSLQGEAFKYGKAFFSPKHKVNVDPEDGVLSNRPIYADGSKLTYEKIDKPFSKSGINRDSNEPRKTTKGEGRNFRTVEEGAGMTEAGVSDYKKKNPGSKLKTAVTGKVKPGSKDAKRRKSFCARSKGWTGPRGRAARARWKC